MSRVLYSRRMSKLDAQRAMRAARYNAAHAQSKPAAPAPATDTSSPGPCGHRSIGGKTCRRPAGHAETTHRYA